RGTATRHPGTSRTARCARSRGDDGDQGRAHGRGPAGRYWCTMGLEHAEVIGAARRGDPDAFAVLWRHHQPQVLRYLSARRIVDPADVASQIWIDVAGSIARFEGDGADFRRWLFTIAHRRVVDEVRRSVRRSQLAERVGTAAGAAVGADQMY